MSKRKRRGQCAFCGSSGDVTTDHVPPKGIYGKPVPPDAITVRACAACNTKSKEDDQYLKRVLAMSSATDQHPEAWRIKAETHRDLDRPESRAFIQATARRSRDVFLDTDNQHRLVYAPTFDYNRKRMKRSVIKIARGLYAHFSGRPLGKSAFIGTLSLAEIDEKAPDVAATLWDMVAFAMASEHLTIRSGAFEAWYYLPADHPDHGIWVTAFYGAFPFVTSHWPTDDDGETAS